jgi:hypothetical protein
MKQQEKQYGWYPAIPAAKHRLGDELIYWFLIRWALWNHFDRMWVQMIGDLPRPAEGPLLCYVNHPSWWDGYIAATINRCLFQHQFELYMMMEEKQLCSYRFFTWSGCFSVDRESPREAMRSVSYISRVLQEQQNRALYIFPQGTITHCEHRPLSIFPGVAHIMKRVGALTLCPIAIRLEFCGEQRPEIFVRCGPTHRCEGEVAVDELTNRLQERLTANMDQLRDAVVAKKHKTDHPEDFQELLRGKQGVNRLFDAAKTMISLRRTQKNHQKH